MKVGDLVEVYGNTPQDIIDPECIGVYVGWDWVEEGWKVLVGDRIEIYARTWWNVVRVEDDVEREIELMSLSLADQ